MNSARFILLKTSCIILLLTISLFAQNTDGLEVYFPFNGNANDESGNGHNGVVAGATLTEDRFGNPSSAYSFNGADNYIGFSTLWNSAPDSITFAAWYNIAAPLEGEKILYHGDNGEFQLFVGGDSAWAGVHLGQSVTDPWYYVKKYTPQNSWQMIAAVWIKGESFLLYLNGEQVDSVGVSSDGLLDPGSGYQPSIGSYGQNLGGYFEGKIDDIRVYSRVLTAGEIDSLFNEGITSAEEIGNAIPTEFELYQNYPNPFNPATKIKYSIPQKAKVKLTVYDLLGREVAVLLNEEKLRGKYEVSFDAGSLSSGFYFYRIQASAFNFVRKMLLLK